MGDQYKRTVLEAMSAEQLIDVVLCGPTVHVMPSFRDTGFTARYVFEPLTNVQFTRDQQVTTARGIVAARLRSAQRQSEVALMRFCFDKLGLPVVGAIREPGFLEGGDFFPAGRGLALCGVGLRSNLAACEQLMRDDLLGTTRLAVVRDDEVCQDRMHLDCVVRARKEWGGWRKKKRRLGISSHAVSSPLPPSSTSFLMTCACWRRTSSAPPAPCAGL